MEDSAYLIPCLLLVEEASPLGSVGSDLNSDSGKFIHLHIW